MEEKSCHGSESELTGFDTDLVPESEANDASKVEAPATTRDLQLPVKSGAIGQCHSNKLFDKRKQSATADI